MNHFFLFALCDIYLVVHMSDIIKQQIGCVILPVDSSLLSSFDQSSFVFSSLSYDDILPFSSLQCMYLPGLPNVGTKSPKNNSMTSHNRLRSLQPLPVAPNPLWWITLLVMSPGEYRTSTNRLHCSVIPMKLPWQNLPSKVRKQICHSFWGKSVSDDLFRLLVSVNMESYCAGHPSVPTLLRNISPDPKPSR